MPGMVRSDTTYGGMTVWPSASRTAPSYLQPDRPAESSQYSTCRPNQKELEPLIGNDVRHPVVDPVYLPGYLQIDCPRVPQYSVAIGLHP